MSRDLRKYARQTNVRLAVGAILVLFVVGDGLIYLFYGGGAALMGILCLLGGMIPVEQSRQAVAQLKQAGALVTYCESDAGHKVSKECLKAMELFFGKF